MVIVLEICPIMDTGNLTRTKPAAFRVLLVNMSQTYIEMNDSKNGFFQFVSNLIA